MDVMDTDIFNALKTIISLREEIALKNLNNNQNYKKANAKKTTFINEAFDISNKLAPKEREVIQDILDMSVKETMEMDAIYLQGIKDCAALYEILIKEGLIIC